MVNISEKLKRLDAYPKTRDEAKNKTYGGAASTLIDPTNCTY